MDQEKKKNAAAPEKEAERLEAEKDALLSDEDLDKAAGGKLRLVSSANSRIGGENKSRN